MTTLTNIGSTPLVVLRRDKPIPGLTALGIKSFNEDAPRLIREALATGRSTRSFVLHVQPDSCSLESRIDLVDFFERNGVRKLGRKLEKLLVPQGAVAVLVDCEDTGVLLMPLSVFLGGER